MLTLEPFCILNASTSAQNFRSTARKTGAVFRPYPSARAQYAGWSAAKRHCNSPVHTFAIDSHGYQTEWPTRTPLPAHCSGVNRKLC